MKHNKPKEERKECKTSNTLLYHQPSKAIKVVYTIKLNQTQKAINYNNSKDNEIGNKDYNSKPIVSKILLSKSKDKNTRIKLNDVLSNIYKEYQQKNANWNILFKEQLLNDINFTFDYNHNSLKSLNGKSSELFLQESLWILMIEYYIKHYNSNNNNNNNKDKLLSSVISLFDQGFNYIIESKNIIQFYYSTIESILPGLKKKEMFELLNGNSQFIIQQGPINFKHKKAKKSTSNDIAERDSLGIQSSSSLMTFNQQLEFISCNNNLNTSKVNNNIQHPEKIEDKDKDMEYNESNMHQDDNKCSSTQCNESSSIEYLHWLSPHLMHIKEEDNESKEKEKDTEDNFNSNNDNDNANDNDYSNSNSSKEIIPIYEQKKYLKVKELMEEIEANYYNKELSLSSNEKLNASHHHSIASIPLTGTKRCPTTPSKSRFSPREEYPIDIVEGSIQKFNQSFSKYNNIH